MSEPRAEQVARAMVSVFIDNPIEITYCSDLLSEIMNKHISVGLANGMRFTFMPRDGLLADCLVAASDKAKNRTFYAQKSVDGSPFDYLTTKQILKISIAVSKAGIKSEIKVRKAYFVYLNGSKVNGQVFNHGTQDGIRFPQSITDNYNGFDSEKEAKAAQKAFEKYYKALIRVKKINSSYSKDSLS